MRESVYNANLAQPALPVSSRIASATGTTVDRHVFENAFRSVGFVVHAGTITDGTHTFAVEVSDDATTWAAADAAHVRGATELTSTSSDTVGEVGYDGPARYVRLSVTVAGATSGGTYGAVAVLSGGRREPVLRA